MIADSISHLRQYAGLYPALGRAADFLEGFDPQSTEPGTYSIDGEHIYAVVQHYETRPADTLLWEYHRKYIDLQCVLQGEERLDWIDTGKLKNSGPYSPERDSATSSEQCPASHLRLTSGQFALFTPDDAHKPKCAAGSPCEVMKVVIKIACP